MGHFEKGKWIDKPIWVINWSYISPNKRVFETMREAELYIESIKNEQTGIVVEEESRNEYRDFVVINIRMVKLL